MSNLDSYNDRQQENFCPICGDEYVGRLGHECRDAISRAIDSAHDREDDTPAFLVIRRDEATRLNEGLALMEKHDLPHPDSKE